MWDPFGASGSNVTTWKSGPNERGTLNILSTCVITLILCVYTCLHLNIPGPDQKTWWKLFQRKFLWLLLGLFAPEFVAFVAFYDWLLAKNNETEMKKHLDPLTLDVAPPNGDTENETKSDQSQGILGNRQAHEKSRRRHRWTRTHSHFALMGGYAFDMSAVPINFAPKQVRALTLRTEGLEILAAGDPDVIPDISEEEILDKSKADGFSKILVCIQALWFLLQCVGRLATHYPISLLELNTFLHAICCLLVYLAWWNKPLDIDTPHYIDCSEGNMGMTCAWLITNSSLRPGKLVWSSYTHTLDRRHVHLHWSALHLTTIASDRDEEEEEEGEQFVIGPTDPNWKSLHVTEEPQRLTQLAYSEGLIKDDKDGKFWRLYSDQRFCGCHILEMEESVAKSSYARLSRTDLECYRLAQLRYQRLGPLPTNSAFYLAGLSYRAPIALPPAWGNADWPDKLQPLLRFPTVLKPVYIYFLGVMIASAVYGGLHLIAWHNQFSTFAESIIWRVCCFILIAPFALSFPLFISLVLWNVICLYLQPFPVLEYGQSDPEQSRTKPVLFSKPTGKSRTIKKVLYQVWVWIPIGVFISCVILYVAARIFLVVESFRNLGHLPEAVYKEPQWSTYLPHFGSG
ncbi:hypothetical protein BKA63DRAFT_499223 [Paraphoma chrysanthemicola]|nr:hypothetical protein BKA63DRAFT_499223 [Paraphoma chrysanthemicola]